MRQYRIITKTTNTDEARLEPMIHAGLYNIPEIRTAVDFAHDNPSIGMIGILIGTRLYSVVVVDADYLLPDHFEFGE